MWEAVPSHHEEGKPGWEGTDSSIEAGGVAELLLGCVAPSSCGAGPCCLLRSVICVWPDRAQL